MLVDPADVERVLQYDKINLKKGWLFKSLFVYLGINEINKIFKK